MTRSIRVVTQVFTVALVAGAVSPVESQDPGLDNGYDRSTGAAKARYSLQAGYGTDQIVCAPAGEKRFSVIYARPSDMSINRYGQLAPAIRNSVRGASGNLNAEIQGLSTSVGARLKVKCNSNRDVNVASVVLATTRAESTRQTIPVDLARLGYDSRNHKYLVFFEGCRARPETVTNCSGGQVAPQTVQDDPSPTAQNVHNVGPDYAIEWCGCSDVTEAHPYGVVDPPSPAGWTFLHEGLHTLGFVQPSAPHSTGHRHHCYQYSDVMCYDDGGTNSSLYVDNEDCLGWRAIDCGHDDYFNPHPAPGSYLSENWNLAAAYVEFIDHSPTPDVSPPFRTVDLRVAGVGQDFVDLEWSPALDRARRRLSVQLERRVDGQSWEIAKAGSANDGSQRLTGLRAGTTYQFSIITTDPSGNVSSRSNVARARTPD